MDEARMRQRCCAVAAARKKLVGYLRKGGGISHPTRFLSAPAALPVPQCHCQAVVTWLARAVRNLSRFKRYHRQNTLTARAESFQNAPTCRIGLC